jgi:hypothetical protein
MPQPLMSIAPHLVGSGRTRRSGSLPSNIQDNEEGFTRSVDPNELTSTHLNALTSGNSRYIRNARGSGAALASSRGLANSSLAAANSEAAAIGAAAPIASEDAGAYRSAASESLQSLAGQRIAHEGNATSMAQQIHGDNTNAYMNQSRIDADRETDLRRRDWDVSDDERDYGRRTTERQQERDWSVDDRDYDERATRRRNREGLAATTISTIFNNPEYMRDPAGAAGMLQFYQDMWNDLFPEGP